MSLKLHLKAGQKIIINGAVLENASNKGAIIMLHNRANILRDTEILQERDAVTPAARVYSAAQCLYLFPDDVLKNLPVFNQLVKDYVEAAPSSNDIVRRLLAYAESQDYYLAMRAARDLISHEGMVLSHGLYSESDNLPRPADGSDFPSD